MKVSKVPIPDHIQACLAHVPNITPGINILLQRLQNLLLRRRQRNHARTLNLQRTPLNWDLIKQCTCKQISTCTVSYPTFSVLLAAHLPESNFKPLLQSLKVSSIHPQHSNNSLCAERGGRLTVLPPSASQELRHDLEE